MTRAWLLCRLPITLMLSVLAACGCRPQPSIQEYEIALPEATTAKSPDVKIKERILGAVVPAGGDGGWWFFKMQGNAEAIAAQRSAVDRFLDSLQFVDSSDDPVTWELPEGWTQIPRSQMVHAAFRIETPGGDQRMTVSKAGGSLLANVNRWRGQVGLEPLAPVQLEDSLRKRMINGRIVLLVDIAGPGGSTGMGGFPPGQLPPGHPKVETPKTENAPSGKN